jgi:hypothetical protein
MTESTAEKVATLVIGAAVAGTAYYVLKTPSLRRLAWRMTITGLTVSLPAWFRREIEQGWRESGRPATAPQP